MRRPLVRRRECFVCSTFFLVYACLCAGLGEVVEGEDEVEEAAGKEGHLQDPPLRHTAHNAQTSRGG